MKMQKLEESISGSENDIKEINLLVEKILNLKKPHKASRKSEIL